MDQLECPSQKVWENRRRWFEDLFDIENKGGAYILGEHALGLLIDLQAVYCCGAFISAVILSCTIIDTHLRETELPKEFDGGIKSVFKEFDDDGELEWLRQRRNELVHLKSVELTAISVDDQWAHRKVHEAEAERAIQLVSRILFMNPWV